MGEFAFLFRGRIWPDSVEQQQETLEKWGRWMAELGKRGLLADPVLPLEDEAKHLRGTGKAVHDGPFAEIKDLVNGFIIVSAANIDEACEVAKSCPIFEQGGGVEVRPVTSMKS